MTVPVRSSQVAEDHVERRTARSRRAARPRDPPRRRSRATCAASRGGAGAASRSRATSPRVALTMWLTTARRPPRSVNARTPTTVRGARRPGRRVRAGAHVDDEPVVRQRAPQRRAPACGEPAEARQLRADREPVGGDPVVGPHDAPQRAGDQHAGARLRRQLRQAQPLVQHAGVDAGRGAGGGGPQRGVALQLARLRRPRARVRRARGPRRPALSLTSAVRIRSRVGFSSGWASASRSSGPPDAGAVLPSEGGSRISTAGAG